MIYSKRHDYSRLTIILILTTILLGAVQVGSAWAQEVPLGATPAWGSERAGTNSIAWGDVDGDGDLDLACTSSMRENVLFLNHDGMLEISPSWTSDILGWIYPWSVAWGDVDGDGDLDLATGNTDYPNTIYFNDGQGLATTPGWWSGESNATYAIAWGDVDGDGDLDLACGNKRHNKLYLNSGSSLATEPAWSSADTNFTNTIAWGDVDGDGDLDLACGNDLSNTVYLNQGGTLTSDPVWFSVPQVETRSVAWGDVDGDGDLDLACGNTEYDFGDHNVLYENIGGTLSDTPIWISDYSHKTIGVAWGDVDGDGDLDLACANHGQANTLYLNDGGALQTAAAWEPDATGRGNAVAWGDMDGDGDLDLAYGMFAEGHVVYRNTSRAFEQQPQWSGNQTPVSSLAVGDVNGDGHLDFVCGNHGQADLLYQYFAEGIYLPLLWAPAVEDRTRSVEFGDIDGDGDLDLVCGNGSDIWPESNTLYDNVDGTLSALPVWTSDRAAGTTSVALADVDRDGDLDLACGNEESLTLYANYGTALDTSPVWEYDGPGEVQSIAWGDVDGDGDPDLACGVLGANLLFLSQGGTLSPTPQWRSAQTWRTNSVAWGDIDGDGDPDLICGNDESNTIYFNEDGELGDTPGWMSVNAETTYDVTCGDVDGDGDLDLVCSNNSQNEVYLNDRGVLSTTASWVSELSTRTYAAELVDFDEDGDLDVVFGHSMSSIMIHHGQGYPVFGGDPQAPTNHVPNNGTQIGDVRVTEAGTNLVDVSFSAVDPESDSFFLVPEYQIEGDFTWRAVETAGGGSLGPFASSPVGTESGFQWNIERIIPGSADYILRLRVVEDVGKVGPIRHAAAYLENVGRPEPRRALLGAEVLRLPAVTVGDTVSVPLALSNFGTEKLVVSNIQVPAPELTFSVPLPLEIAAAGRDTVWVQYAPREHQDVSGTLLVESNDVIEPLRAVTIIAEESIPLEYEWTLLSAEDDLPLGEAVTILLRPRADVHIERGDVWYRRAGSEGEFISSNFETIENDFVALIPGDAVTESGIEFYVEVENSGIFAVDPVGAPEGGVHFRSVVPPEGIVTFALPNEFGDYQAGREVIIQAELPQGSEFVQGVLRYRSGGESDYVSVPLEGGSLLLGAAIPADDVGCRGLEYYVEVETTNRVLTDPPLEPGSNPYSIPVHVNALKEPASHSARAFRMVSMPLSFNTGDYRDWVDLLAGDPAFGPYDPVRWRTFRYDPTSEGYRELDPGGEDEVFRLVPGKAFWLVCGEEHQVGIGPADGHSTPTDEPYRITLASGWNQVGNPFCFDVAWESVSVDGQVSAAEDTLVGSPVHYGSGGSYRGDVTILEPFEGYWVLNRHDGEVDLHVAPLAAESDKGDGPKVDWEWRIEVTAAAGEVFDAGNSLGVCAGASDGFDRYDRAEAPMLPGDAVSLYFPHGEWSRFGGPYSRDVRSSGSLGGLLGQAFPLDVAKNFAGDDDGQVTLEFSGLESVPIEMDVVLVDRQLDQSHDLREISSYAFFLAVRNPVHGREEARFALLVGNDEFVKNGLPELPTRTSLSQNYPNPFNPSTMIRFDLAEPCRATLRIYNVNGVLIRTLYDGRAESGGYEKLWGGRDDDGRRMASGLYFARLTTDLGYVETRKLVLVK